MIVIDASALADILAPTALGRELEPLARENAGALHAPAIIDAEVASAIRGLERGGELSGTEASAALEDLGSLAIARHEDRSLLARAWALRHNFSIYDALYVALAQVAQAPLLTSDARLAAAAAQHAAVDVLP